MHLTVVTNLDLLFHYYALSLDPVENSYYALYMAGVVTARGQKCSPAGGAHPLADEAYKCIISLYGSRITA